MVVLQPDPDSLIFCTCCRLPDLVGASALSQSTYANTLLLTEHNGSAAAACIIPQVLSIYPTTIRRRILRHLYLRHLRSSYLFRWVLIDRLAPRGLRIYICIAHGACTAQAYGRSGQLPGVLRYHLS